MCSAVHNRIFFTSNFFVASLSTLDHLFSFYAREWPVGYFAIDQNYLYWTSQYLVSAIKRMPLDYEPLFVLRDY